MQHKRTTEKNSRKLKILNVEPICHGKLPKVVSVFFTTLNWEREGQQVCFVNVH
jgi:hypothetical protein